MSTGRPSARIHSLERQAAVTLSAGGVEATFLPDLGMLGSSLRFGGEEYMALGRKGVTAYARGGWTGLPLLAPWANRIDGHAYTVGGVEVKLAASKVLPLDGSGLPIHGTMNARRGWEVRRLEAGNGRATLEAVYRYGEDAELMAFFPFAHDLEVEASVGEDGLRVKTTVRPTGDREVPVAFGWHPYFQIPGVKRKGLKLHLPERERLVTDKRLIPTGETVPEAAEGERLGKRIFDTGYRLKEAQGARLGIEGGDRKLWCVFEEGYPYAQVYAPARKHFVCLEPMAAATNAFKAGGFPVAKPGGTYVASFRTYLER